MSVPSDDDEIRELLDDDEEEEEEDDEEDEPSAGPSQQATRVAMAIVAATILVALLVGLAVQNHWLDGKGLLPPGTRCVLASGRQAGVLRGRLQAVYAGQALAVVLDPGPAGVTHDDEIKASRPTHKRA
jgi:hypothetical protein